MLVMAIQSHGHGTHDCFSGTCVVVLESSAPSGGLFLCVVSTGCATSATSLHPWLQACAPSGLCVCELSFVLVFGVGVLIALAVKPPVAADVGLVADVDGVLSVAEVPGLDMVPCYWVGVIPGFRGVVLVVCLRRLVACSCR